MKKETNILTDTFGRKHSYLRISLTERCNLRCDYCMPSEGIQLSPKDSILTYEEIETIAKEFVAHGVTKIRLTGGEPLIRKDFPLIIEKLTKLPVELTLTTNGVIVDRFIELFKEHHISKINVSLDSLNPQKNESITRRDYFQKVYDNILLLVREGFVIKVNCVLMRGVNDDEILDFVNLSEKLPVHIRFIEFMPFDGNKWDLEKIVSLREILKTVNAHYKSKNIIRLEDSPNDTAKNYKIINAKGTFAIISSVTNPFCDSCNRIRLTANGQLKNCLFSTSETDLLTPMRQGKSIVPMIQKVIRSKKEIRNGMNSLEEFKNTVEHGKNRSMITIGG